MKNHENRFLGGGNMIYQSQKEEVTWRGDMIIKVAGIGDMKKVL